jgi:hypothetical protein
VKLTYQERIAAGWVEHWGLFDSFHHAWMTHIIGNKWSTNPEKRERFGSEVVAARYSREGSVSPRRFWSRKKSKPSEPVKSLGQVAFEAYFGRGVSWDRTEHMPHWERGAEAVKAELIRQGWRAPA